MSVSGLGPWLSSDSPRDPQTKETQDHQAGGSKAGPLKDRGLRGSVSTCSFMAGRAAQFGGQGLGQVLQL